MLRKPSSPKHLVKINQMKRKYRYQDNRCVVLLTVTLYIPITFVSLTNHHGILF